MSEFSPTPPEEVSATDHMESSPSEESSPSPREDAPAEKKEARPSGQFGGKAKRIIALLFVSNILFAISAFLIWQSGNTRVAALNDAIDSLLEEDPYETKEAPVRAADVLGNFTDEMKIPQTAYEGTLEREERAFDHPGSPYFYNYDFYNAENTETLTILPHFRTIQQMKNFTCGIASMEMVMDYYGKLGDWNEEKLVELVPEHREDNGQLLHTGYCLDQLIDVFNQVGGFELETTYDYKSDNYWDLTPALFQNYIEEGIPVIVGSVQRGGHWMVIIGYDDMGTPLKKYDDVLIMADSSDSYDHNCDGYSVINAMDYFSSYSFYSLRDLEDHQADYCFIAARPLEE